MMKAFSAYRFKLRQLLALLLAFCLSAVVLPPAAVSAAAAEPFYQSSVDKLLDWGVLSGYPDGSIQAQNPITRAEFVAMVNRAYGYTKAGATPFTDVPVRAWYAGDIAIAYNAGYFNGTSATTASPNSPLTREQAMVLLAKNMRLDAVDGEVMEFADGHDFAEWSSGYVRAAAEKGLIGGYTDGSFRPGNNITRGEMSVLLGRALGTLVNSSGTRSLGDVYGNVTINTPGTTLKDTVVAGDLYISGGLDLNGVELDNVRVLGDIVVAGSGEAQSGDSVVLFNTRADSLKVDSINGQYVSLRAEGETRIGDVSLRSNAFILDRTNSGMGLLDISIDGGANFTLAGNLETVANKAPASTLHVASASVDKLTVDEEAVGSRLIIDNDSVVRNLTLDTGTPVTGEGDVDQLNVNTAGSTASMIPDGITIRPGLTANIAGTVMDASKARELSSDPRLLAGYPKVTKIAATSATGVFSANKAGTLYWAVTPVSSGSVNADSLIEPGTTATLTANGNVKITAAEKEFTANITKLTTATPYYLSTVFVDSRGERSPLKVVSFTTIDTTVPAINSGYPETTQNDYESSTAPNRFHVQITVRTSKDCDLYWAVYPKGVTAPTAADFRSEKLSGSIAHGTKRAERNERTWFDVYGLTERTDYVAYIWLNDSDNGQSSAVKAHNFTTVDGTPPTFLYGTPESGRATATAIPVKAHLDEASTVYWTVVPVTDDDYEREISKDENGNTVTDEFGKPVKQRMSDEKLARKIESGTGSAKNGSTRMNANRDYTINMSGLQAETLYNLYIVAKDSSGNYSTIHTLYNVSTLDTSAPTARLEFTSTRVNSAGDVMPKPDTSIRLIFTEDVMRAGDDKANSLYSLWTNSRDMALTQGQREAAAAALQTLLNETVFFYDDTGSTTERLRSDPAHNPGWAIDYTQVTVTRGDNGKEVIVTFPYDEIDGTVTRNSALNLRSGSTYHFELDNLTDLAEVPNAIKPKPYPLDKFKIVDATVTLTDLALTAEQSPFSRTETDSSGAQSTAKVLPDMSFSLLPTGTKTVDPNVFWDLILWSDTSVEYQIYAKSRNETEGNGEGSEWKPVGGTNGRGQAFLTTGTTLSAQSLRTLDSSSKIFSWILTTDLDETKIYDFAIKFTKVGTDTNEANWSSEINFLIDVVAGSSNDIEKVQTLTNSRSRYQAEIANPDTTSREIGSPPDFQRRKTFLDSEAPEFIEGAPIISATDVSAQITVNLSRPGTVYYVIAPADGSIPTYQGSTAITYDNNNVPENNRRDHSNPFYVTMPADLDIMNAQQVYALSPQIFTPSPSEVSGNAASALPPVNGLTPNTEYFAYFVLQGTGQMHSQVELVKFTTEKETNPILSLSSYSKDVSVSIQNSIPSDVTWALVQTSRLRDLSTSLLKNGLETLLSTSGLSDTTAENYSKYVSSTLTLIDAMNTMVVEDNVTLGSVFDLYASAACKSDVSSIIKAGAAGANVVIIEGGTLTLGNGRNPVWARTVSTTKVEGSTEYAFLALAESSEGAGTGYSAIYPVKNQSTTPPAVSSVLNNLALTGTGSGTAILGTITLRFDQDLYFMTSTSGKKAVDTSSAVDGRTTSISVTDGQFVSEANGLTPNTSANSAVDTATGSITLSVNIPADGATASGTFSTNRGICNEGGITSSSPLAVDVEYNASTHLITVTVTHEGDPIIRTISTGISVSGVRINEGDFTIGVGATKQLTTTITPSNATDTRVLWSSSNTKYATVSANGLVTGVANGSATITATTVDGSHTASVLVTVSSTGVTGVRFSGGNTSLTVPSDGSSVSLQISYSVFPTTAANKAVSFRWVSLIAGESVDTTNAPSFSYNDTAVTVTASGTTKTGTWNLRVTTDDGGYNDTITVSVIKSN